jgi:hypothetical protein
MALKYYTINYVGAPYGLNEAGEKLKVCRTPHSLIKSYRKLQDQPRYHNNLIVRDDLGNKIDIAELLAYAS